MHRNWDYEEKAACSRRNIIYDKLKSHLGWLLSNQIFTRQRICSFLLWSTTPRLKRLEPERSKFSNRRLPS